jgi:voltage-gated potassium channel
LWFALAWRAAMVLLLIGIALSVHWLDRGGLRDNVDGAISFPDVLYFTMITITTVGYGDIVPVTERARLFDTFVVTPIRLFIWLIFLGTAYDFLLKRTWDRWRMAIIQRTLQGHIVVVGYGASGAEAVRELLDRGTAPEAIVVIDERQDARDAAAALGVAVVEGDATRNATLEAVRIDRARALIVAAGRDDTSILIVLTAHGLAPDVPISVSIRARDNVGLAHQAGAATVINPVSFTGLLLAGSTGGGHVAEYITDLASNHGPIMLHERTVRPDEIGQPLSGIDTGVGLRIYRDGDAHECGTPAVEKLEAGDRIIEIVRDI